MRKKKLSILFIILIVSLTLGAQNSELQPDEAKIVKSKIIEKSKNTHTIKSDFNQIKHLDFLTNDIESTGELVFKSPNYIKWEYQTPFYYGVVFKNDKLYINDDGERSKINLNANKTFKSLNNLIIRSVKGDLFDENQFFVQFFKHEKGYKIIFSPKDKSLMQIIQKFILFFDENDFKVLEIKMLENKTDYTRIKFINQKLNVKVADEVFNN